jgi:hypothetical protein
MMATKEEEAHQNNMRDMLDEESTFAQCNTDLLECLEGSSSHNIYRRRMLMWHLMKMNDKRGEGGVWEDLFFNNIQLRAQTKELASQLKNVIHEKEIEHNAHATQRNEDIMTTDRVVSRLKTKLEKMENLWVTERDRAKKLDVQHAIDSEVAEDHVKAMTQMTAGNTSLLNQLKSKDNEIQYLKVQIIEINQLNKERTGIAPSLRMIVKAALAEQVGS